MKACNLTIVKILCFEETKAQVGNVSGICFVVAMNLHIMDLSVYALTGSLLVLPLPPKMTRIW